MVESLEVTIAGVFSGDRSSNRLLLHPSIGRVIARLCIDQVEDLLEMEGVSFEGNIFTESLEEGNCLGQVDHNDIFLRRRVFDTFSEETLDKGVDTIRERIYTTHSKAMRVEVTNEEDEGGSSWVKEFISTFNKVNLYAFVRIESHALEWSLEDTARCSKGNQPVVVDTKQNHAARQEEQRRKVNCITLLLCREV